MNIAVFAVRFIIPVLLIVLLFSCVKNMFKIGKRHPILRLVMEPNGAEFNITCAESAIGRSRICDVRINVPSVSRRHAVLTYIEDVGVKISQVGNCKIRVNNKKVDGFTYLNLGDVIEMGGVQLKVCNPKFEDISSGKKPTVKGVIFQAVLLSIVQLLMLFEFVAHYGKDIPAAIPVSFTTLIAGQWIYLIINKFKGNLQIEIMGFLLTSFGFSVAASAFPSSLFKQLVCAVLGFAVFVAFGFVFKNIELTMKMRYFIGAAAILMFAYNILFGKEINGAKNWIEIGSFTIQPSELIKFAFIFAGAATLERLLSTRNILLFLAYSGICIGALFLMRDFGTASIYFVTMLIIAYMRSGDIKAIAFIVAAAGIGAALIIKAMPYVANRFAAYRHAWELASGKGYQQTRTMIAIASGGLFGLGGGEGNLDRVAAADTDLVFGILCEEWGLIAALCAALCFVIFAVYSLRCTPRTNSSYYAIAACAASGLFLFQISLNIFGSTDLLPLTGVTMPFISNGGSSMIASWALLSFIKAVGTQVIKEADVG
ncbi:MAG: FtsW/RodA/SpoVE family cell cycle protein [Clostridia bacterium]|nr:FtsW/RodA/SpoVE family cell cycle protein [Clostridia bacterium]